MLGTRGALARENQVQPGPGGSRAGRRSKPCPPAVWDPGQPHTPGNLGPCCLLASEPHCVPVHTLTRSTACLGDLGPGPPHAGAAPHRRQARAVQRGHLGGPPKPVTVWDKTGGDPTTSESGRAWATPHLCPAWVPCPAQPLCSDLISAIHRGPSGLTSPARNWIWP